MPTLPLSSTATRSRPRPSHRRSSIRTPSSIPTKALGCGANGSSRALTGKVLVYRYEFKDPNGLATWNAATPSVNMANERISSDQGITYFAIDHQCAFWGTDLSR